MKFTVILLFAYKPVQKDLDCCKTKDISAPEEYLKEYPCRVMTFLASVRVRAVQMMSGVGGNTEHFWTVTCCELSLHSTVWYSIHILITDVTDSTCTVCHF